MIEKRKATYDLTAFKAACAGRGNVDVTTSAIRTAAALGLDRADIMALIQTMERRHFYKSKTSYADHRTWQDVYHVPYPAGILYVKFTADAVTEFLPLSFKEKDRD